MRVAHFDRFLVDDVSGVANLRLLDVVQIDQIIAIILADLGRAVLVLFCKNIHGFALLSLLIEEKRKNAVLVRTESIGCSPGVAPALLNCLLAGFLRLCFKRRQTDLDLRN